MVRRLFDSVLIMHIPALPDFPQQFETERLLLRCPRPEDARRVHATLLGAQEGMRQFPASMPAAVGGISYDACEKYCRDSPVTYQARTHFEWLLFLKGTDTMLGAVALQLVDWSVPKADIGYWMDGGFSGQGYMTEAVKAITEIGFGLLKFRRIDAAPEARNRASCAVLERAGYLLEGTLVNHRADPDGTLRDSRMYAAVR